MRKILYPLLLSMCLAFSAQAQSGALNFVASSHEQVDLGMMPQTLPSTFTIEAWIRPTSFSTSGSYGNSIFGADRSTGSSGGFALRCGSSGILSLVIGNGNWPEALSPSGTLQLNQWQHVAGTYDGDTIKIFVNGSMVASQYSSTPIVNDSTILSYIGASNFSNRNFDGDIEDVRLWNVERTPSQIAANACTAYPAGTANLVEEWLLDEGTGTTTTGINGWVGTLMPTATPPTWITVNTCGSCADPYGLTMSNITPTTADFGFISSSSAWEIEWGATGFTQGAGNLESASSNPYTIGNTTPLSSNTTYDAYVRANCTASSNGYSNWVGPYTFTTPCNALSIPFTESFDSNTTTENCWTVLNLNGDGDQWNLNSTAYPFSGDQSAAMYTDFNGGNNNDWMITPGLTLTGNERLKFEYRVRSSFEPNDFEVLVSTTGTSPSDFTDTILPLASYSNTTYEQKIIDLSNYTGTIYIAFHIPSGGLDGWYLYIDDVEVVSNPPCPEALAVTTSNITTTSADISWSSPGSKWIIEWGPTGFTPGAGNFDTAYANNFTIGSGANQPSPSTIYDYYITNDCSGSGNGNSTVAGPYTFSTLCNPLNIPFVEGFDSTTTTENCWTILDANNDGDQWDLSSTANPFSGDQSASLYTDGNGGNDNDWLISPGLNLTGNERLKFEYSVNSSFEPNDFEVLVSTTGINPSDFTDTILPLAVYSNTSYDQKIIDLSAYTGTIYIAWHVPQGGVDGWYLYIDDVQVITNPPCPEPLSVITSNVTTNSADISWSSPGTTWYINWGPTGFNQASPTQYFDTTYTNSFTIGSGINQPSPNTTYDYYIVSDCNGSGNGTSIWVGPYTFSTLCAPINIPFTESFDSTTTTENCWTVLNMNGDGDQWDLNSTAYPFSGDQSASMYTDFNGGNNDDWMISPALILTGNERLKFEYRVRSSSEPNDFEVLASTTGTNPSDFTDTILPFNSYSNTSYQQAILNLSAFSDTTYIAWHIPPGGLDGWYLYIDNVIVEPIPSCPEPDSLSMVFTTSDTAIFNWTSGGTSSFILDYGAPGHAPGTGTLLNTANTSDTITGLTAATSYDVYVQTNCGSDSSIWVGPVNFTTACVKQSLPYSETFDADLGCFLVTQNGGTTLDTWQWVADYNGSTLDADTGFAFVNSDAAGNGTSLDEILSSPIFDASSVGSGSLVLEFDQYYRSLNDTASVDVWNGSQWVNILKQSSTVGALGSPDHQFLNVTPYANSNFQVRFHYYNANWAWYWGIDNFDLTLYPCGIADSLDTGLVTSHTADLEWNSNGSNWNIVWGPTGFNQASGMGTMILNVSSNPYTLTGLGADSCYDFYVQDTCTGIGTGPWQGPFTFCTPPTCPVPTALGVVAGSITTSAADIYWTPGNNAAGFTIEYGPAGFAPGSGMLATSGNDTLSLSGLASSTQYDFYVQDSCGIGDLSLWVGPFSFATDCAPYIAPYYEDFDQNGWIADDVDFSAANSQVGVCWTRDPDGTSDYDWRVRSIATGSSSTGPDSDSTGGNFVYTEASNGASGDTAKLTSPVIDIANLTDPYLTFAYYFYGSEINQMLVQVNGGTGWTTMDTIVGQFQTSGSQSWLVDSISLMPYLGSNSLQVRFSAVSGGCCGGDLAIDAFSVSDFTSCPVPSNVAITPIACDSIMVSWSSSEDSTYLALAPSGGIPTSAMLVQNDTVAYIGGTTANTNYDLYMASICGGDTSAYLGPISFNSGNAGAPTTSFTYNVNGYDVSFDASGSMGNGNSYSWDFGDGSTGVGDTISHTYASGGSQQVKLTITNACGTTDTTFTVAGISLEEIALGAKVSIFPNPSHDVANVDVNLDQKGTITIELLSLNGKLISSKTYGSSHQVKDQLDLSHLPNGVYMIRIKTDNGNINRKLIKE